jgi:glyoxylase-like metal-dependent hydrolase (beta-lactamase superfamily II)
MVGKVTTPVNEPAEALPGWVTLVRAPNPGPMTLDGTNSWLLTAPGGGTVLVDPGPLDDGHLDRLAGYEPSLILLTHGHPDHTDGLPALLDRLGGVPVWDRVAERRVLAGLDGLDGLDIQLLATPGHTADSVCFRVERDGERVIVTGDTILGRGTAVVAHPDGRLGDYLASLNQLEGFVGIPALPGHGPALADCGAAARAYLDHREARLDQVRQALAEGARTPRDVVERVYADVDRALWPAAEWSVRAQLDYLESSPASVRWDTP